MALCPVHHPRSCFKSNSSSAGKAAVEQRQQFVRLVKSEEMEPPMHQYSVALLPGLERPHGFLSTKNILQVF